MCGNASDSPEAAVVRRAGNALGIRYLYCIRITLRTPMRFNAQLHVESDTGRVERNSRRVQVFQELSVITVTPGTFLANPLWLCRSSPTCRRITATASTFYTPTPLPVGTEILSRRKTRATTSSPQSRMGRQTRIPGFDRSNSRPVRALMKEWRKYLTSASI